MQKEIIFYQEMAPDHQLQENGRTLGPFYFMVIKKWKNKK